VKKVFLMVSMVLVPLIGMNASADPITYGFYNISNNNPLNADIGEAQLFVDVSSAGNQVAFQLYNTGPLASSITDIYFDDGVLLGIASINNGPNVAFSQGASPSDLPSGNNAVPPFETTPGFSADSDPPTQLNGVNPNEWVQIIFDLQIGKTYAMLLADLASGALRIGIHVQGFADGGSESFINNPNPVPEPATLLLLGSGLIGLAGVARRRFKKEL